MKITNVHLFRNGKFSNEEVIFDDHILKIGENLEDEQVIDGEGQYLYPGFIDCHNHGGWSISFRINENEDEEEFKEKLKRLSLIYPEHGVTAVYPTLSGNDYDLVRKSVIALRQVRNQLKGAKYLSLQFEGLYPSLKRYMNEKCVNPTKEHTDYVVDNDYSDIALFHVSPDLPGAIEWCDYMISKDVWPTVGNTQASSQDVFDAADHGLCHADHMYNGYKALHHREDGAAVAVLLDDRIKAQLTVDGYHVATSWVRLILKAKGFKNVYGTTDQSSASGIAEGVHILPNGKKLIARDGQIFNEDGTISSGNMALNDVLKAARDKVGLTMEEVGLLYGDNVADCLEIKDRGKIEVGRVADFVLMDKDYHVLKTIIDGKVVYSK